MKIYENILGTIGNTPIVKLNRKKWSIKPEILMKLEYFNPGGSLKDRIGISMIDAAEKAGVLKKGSHIVEATSGNTGISLAMVCSVKGYKLTITTPQESTKNRLSIYKILGANVISTDPLMGMQGAVEKSYELAKNDPSVILIKQFSNPANADAHRKTTAREIIESCIIPPSVFVAGIGTGGSITGIGEIIKMEYGNSTKIIGVEPEESPYLTKKIRAPHNIQGIGAGMTLPLLRNNVIDKIMTVSLKDSIKTLKKLALNDGIIAGLSSGAVLTAALRISNEYTSDDKILCLFGDGGRRYLKYW
ncbi:MAG: PLP-dependent cysteine synthase family protein [Promethearchaeota archaeon]